MLGVAKADDGIGEQELSGEEDSRREVVRDVARSVLVLFPFPGVERLKEQDIARCWDIFF